ncbi:MAG: DinB family protein [Candidatus Pseudobacter hemicellulosilyticus]|uniref:DinB family protein n=1 Tax=Candidatus Pseudobacter hemicellulosilyticus TaxID=3121375 RepID=A0AAJ6BH19_9BACT|nr:MAG: DinB family protein [Pseudobacter sp.]
MKELLLQYAAYNAWANQRILDCITALPEASAHQALASSFPTLYATLLHIWDTESAWYQRVRLQEHVIRPGDSFTGTIQDLATSIRHQDQVISSWVQQASEAALLHVMKYHTSKREPVKQPVWQVLMHAFNHSSYHRGQLVTMLRQSGVERIPNTDFIAFTWLRKPRA